MQTREQTFITRLLVHDGAQRGKGAIIGHSVLGIWNSAWPFKTDVIVRKSGEMGKEIARTSKRERERERERQRDRDKARPRENRMSSSSKPSIQLSFANTNSSAVYAKHRATVFGFLDLGPACQPLIRHIVTSICSWMAPPASVGKFPIQRPNAPPTILGNHRTPNSTHHSTNHKFRQSPAPLSTPTLSCLCMCFRWYPLRLVGLRAQHLTRLTHSCPGAPCGDVPTLEPSTVDGTCSAGVCLVRRLSQGGSCRSD